MAVTIEVEDQHIVYGLMWGEVQDPKKENAEVNAMAKLMHGAYKTKLQTKTATHYGFAEEGHSLAKLVKRGRAHSAVALFANHSDATENSLLLHKVQDKKVAIVALVKGVYYLDVVVARNAVLDRVETLKNETNVAYVVYGDCADLVPESIALTPDELLRGDVKRALLKKHTDSSSRKAIILALIVLGLGYGGLEWHKKEVKRQEMEELARNQVDPVQLYKTELANVLPTILFTRNDMLTQLMPSVGKTETSHEGWRLLSVSCFKNGQCHEKWKRASGNNLSFMQGHSHSVIFGPDDTATRVVVSNVKPTILNVSNLPEQAVFTVQISSMLQDLVPLKVIGKVENSGLLGLPAGVTPANIPKGIGLASGKFEVGGPVGLLYELAQALPENITTDEISVSIPDGNEQDAKFLIKGSYYVKN